MRLTQALLKSGRSAWKGQDFLQICVILIHNNTYHFFFLGPYFIPFPNLGDALSNHTPIRTRARSSTILPSHVGCVCPKIFYKIGETELFVFDSIKFEVYNGKDYLPVSVTQDMVGHKLGEFSVTKKRFTFRCVALVIFLFKRAEGNWWLEQPKSNIVRGVLCI